MREALERARRSTSSHRDFVLETIAVNMPNEDYEQIFETFVRWARFGDLFAYDEATETLSLP